MHTYDSSSIISIYSGELACMALYWFLAGASHSDCVYFNLFDIQTAKIEHVQLQSTCRQKTYMKHKLTECNKTMPQNIEL